MKRGTIEHPKTLALMRALNVQRWGAVGILESLWHWAAKYTPQGDIGKFSNADIASGVSWAEDSDKLIEALVSSHFLDMSGQYRLVIHDWQDHADEAVKKFLSRNNLTFIQKERTKEKPLPLPLPLPPKTTSRQTCRAKVETCRDIIIIPEVLKPYETEIREWLAYKQEKGQTYKPRGLRALFTYCTKLGPNLPSAIQNSMAKNYAGIYAANGGGNANPRSNPQQSSTRAGHQDPGHAKDYADLESRAVQM